MLVLCYNRRHRCPHKVRRPSSAQCQLTQYQKTYQGSQTLPSKSCKPEGGLARPSSGAAGHTTHQLDYKVHPVNRRRTKSAEPFREKIGEFDHTTEYGRQFAGHISTEAAKALYPKRTRRLTAPMETSTEHSRSFVAWPMPERGTMIKCDDYKAPTVPMLLETTTGITYKGQRALPAESKRPAHTAYQSDQPLEAETTHDAEYKPKVAPRYESRESEKYRPPRKPFNGLSTVQDTYRQHVGVHPPKPFKPNQQGQRHTAPMDDNTTHSVAYQAWQVQRPAAREPQQHIPPRGDLEGTTTHNQTYINPGRTEPERAQRPSSRLRTKSEPMLAITTHTDAFKNWKVQLDRPTRTHERLEPPKFEGKTEFQSSYTGKQTKPMPNFKPLETVQAPSNFCGMTHYQEEYFRKTVPPCPATGLYEHAKTGKPSATSNLAFTHATTSGHHFFQPGSAVGSKSEKQLISIP